MKRKVVVLSHWMEIGGAEKSLIGLLNSLDTSRYDIDLFLCRHSGELMRQIPDSVSLLPEIPQMAAIAKPVRELLQKPQLWGVVLGRVLAKIATKRYYRTHQPSGEKSAEIDFTHRFVQPFLPAIQPNVTYDAAISFLAPHYLACTKVKANIRIAWIHTDYQNIDINLKSEKKIWRKYEYIASISDKCTENFRKKFGDMGNQLLCVENVLDTNLLKQQAQEAIDIQKRPGERLLCSVGRYSYAKNFDNVPLICKALIQAGIPVRWIIIGFGGDEDLIRQKIREAGMEGVVVLLGKKENPYPYINACDLYVQPSRYEGKAVTVREAQALGKPVVITDFQTAKSQLENGVDGVIVPMDNEGCAAGIAALLRDPERMRQLSAACRERDYSNREEVKKLYRLIDGTMDMPVSGTE